MGGVRVKKEDKVNIITVYNNGKIKEVKGGMRKIIKEMTRRGKRIVIAGDFNASIGKWQVNSDMRVKQKRAEHRSTRSLIERECIW